MMNPDDYIRRILNIIELLLVPVIQTVSEQYGGVRGTAHAHLPWRNASTVNCRLFKKIQLNDRKWGRGGRVG